MGIPGATQQPLALGTVANVNAGHLFASLSIRSFETQVFKAQAFGTQGFLNTGFKIQCGILSRHSVILN
ncbi:hypothetical protein HMEPL2_11820 [Vreelandella aquamarina]|uniref:Uncharacterized protein n=1 Tax=Vreelandella aquamarina TaxID=77097 RepID=A0A6F8X8X2_9GAMM|nr:hypothetical protein HMEPL2_11820 [Halomonas meridiana]